MDFAEARRGHPRNHRCAERIQLQRRRAALYRFFWSEYCDWYVEASKAVLCQRQRRSTDATNGANTLAVIDFVLSHTLRLFHPFLPFITEELWHGMGYREDMPDDQGGKTIMFAPGPSRSTKISKAITASMIATSKWSTRSMNWSRRAAICAAPEIFPRARR